MRNIEFNEYGEKVCACFKPGTPKCPPQAVIPSLTIENKQGIKGLANCLVHIADINTTVYVDDRSRLTIIWAGPVEAEGYDFVGNPLGLRSQTVYDFANNIGAYYNAQGEYRTFNLTEA